MQRIEIDGSSGEGGGQILRTSLALSLITGLPFRLYRIRALRQKPGLQQQHLTAVLAAQALSNAQVSGAGLRSQELEFVPGPIIPGDYHFAVGTAGSAPLVLQTVLPALLKLSAASHLTLEGGTHNPLAPSYDFLERCFVPLIRRLGPRVSMTLERPGFYPAGGGRFQVHVEPTPRLQPLDLLERGPILNRHARVLLSGLPRHIADREVATIRELLGWDAEECTVETVERPLGPGNAILLTFEAQQVTGVFTGIGQRGVTAEAVARAVAQSAGQWLDAGVPVDEHLADQLLLPLALAGGSFRTTRPTLHTVTNAEVVKRFLPVQITMEQETDQVWKITLSNSEHAPSRTE